MFPVIALLAVIAMILSVVSASGRVPLWPAVFVLALLALLAAWPRV